MYLLRETFIYCFINYLYNTYSQSWKLQYFFREAGHNLILVRCWIRGHYRELTKSNEVTCNHCNLEIIVNVQYLDILHKHLVEAHPDKLTEEEKKNVKVSWVWDYFTLGDSRATCNLCGISLSSRRLSNLIIHLKLTHQ